MTTLYANNIATTLASDITDAATSISVADATGMPSPTGSDYFWLTLENAARDIEIVKVTARSGTTLTVTRGQDGTTAGAFSAGDRAELRIAAAGLGEFLQASDNLADIGDEATARSNLGLGSSNNVEFGTVNASTSAGSNSFKDTTDDTQIVFYADSLSDYVIEATQGTNGATKKVLSLNKYGGEVHVNNLKIPATNVNNNWSAKQTIDYGGSLPLELKRLGTTGGVGIRFQNDNGYFDLFGTSTGAGTGELSTSADLSISGLTTSASVLISENGSTAASGSADTLVVRNEATGSNGISIISGNANNGAIFFGRPSDVDAGRIVYEHSTDDFLFRAASTYIAQWDNDLQAWITFGEVRVSKNGINSHLNYGANSDNYLSFATAGSTIFRSYNGSSYDTEAEITSSLFTSYNNVVIASGSSSKITLDNSSSTSYDVVLSTGYDYDGWFRVTDGDGTVRFSVGRDGNCYNGLGGTGNKLATENTSVTFSQLTCDHTGDDELALWVGDVTDYSSNTGVYMRTSGTANFTALSGATFNWHIGGGNNNMILTSTALQTASFQTPSGNNNAKYKLWGGSTDYAMGMSNTETYGAVTSYATVFTMGNVNTYGWIWKDSGHTTSTGAMSVSTEGKLTVASWITAGGDVTANSDRRLKENIRPLEDVTERFMKLKPSRYDWKDKDRHRTHDFGMIAQDVQAQFPELVLGDDILSLDYSRMAVVLTDVVQRQQKQIDELAEEIKKLRKDK